MNWNKLKKTLIKITEEEDNDVKNIWVDLKGKISRHFENENIITLTKNGTFEIERYQLLRTIPPQIDFLPIVKIPCLDLRFLKTYLTLLESKGSLGTFSDTARKKFLLYNTSHDWAESHYGIYKANLFYGYTLWLGAGWLSIRFDSDKMSFYEDTVIDLDLLEVKAIIEYLEGVN